MGRFESSYVGIGEMLNADFMAAEMLARAERGKAFAESTAPFDATSKDGGHYRDSFTVAAGTRGGPKADRAFGRVTNTDEAAFFIEVGTRDTPAHHTLGKALDVMEAGS
jgi:hypothetical protein